MERLAAKLEEFIRDDLLLEGKEYDQAKNLLDKNIMPDGEKWPRKIDVMVGYNGDVIVRGVKRRESDKGTIFTFTMDLKPGDGGGAGATIEAAASNHFFNLVGTDSKQINGMKGAFESKVKSSTRNLGTQLHKWFSDPKNWVWRVVGYKDKDSWGKPTVNIVKVKTNGAMVDPTRRKWPAGRTEIWVPLSVTVQALMKGK